MHATAAPTPKIEKVTPKVSQMFFKFSVTPVARVAEASAPMPRLKRKVVKVKKRLNRLFNVLKVSRLSSVNRYNLSVRFPARVVTTPPDNSEGPLSTVGISDLAPLADIASAIFMFHR
ncbi:hypothetical protein D3C84_1051570 [compost metagenome]